MNLLYQSAVKYWYDPENPDSIGLATPCKKFINSISKITHGKNSILRILCDQQGKQKDLISNFIQMN